MGINLGGGGSWGGGGIQTGGNFADALHRAGFGPKTQNGGSNYQGIDVYGNTPGTTPMTANPIAAATQAVGNMMNIGQNSFDPTAGVSPAQNLAPLDPRVAVSAPTIDKVDFAGNIGNALGQGGPNFGAADALGAAQGGLAAALQARSNATLGQQNTLIGQLQGDAVGNGPGTALAKNLATQAAEENSRRMAGAIAGTRGINPALAARLTAQQTGLANQGAAAQGVNAGLQAALSARGQLGGMLGQEQGLATSQGAGLLNTARGQGIDQAIGQGNLANNRLGTMVTGLGAQNQAINTGALGAAGINADNMQAKLSSDTQVGLGNLNAQTANNQQKTTITQGNADNKAKIVGGVANAAGAGIVKGVIPAAAHGAVVPGRAEHPGDDTRNDTKLYALSPGEAVIPRTAMDDPSKAHRFLDALMSQGKKKEGGHYGHVLAARRELAAIKSQIQGLQKQLGGKAS